jgi:phosphoglycolate phosphatase
MNIDSIIFDLDGTLWNSTDGMLKAWNKVIEGNKKVKEPITLEVLKSLMGMQIPQIGTKLFPYLEKSEQKEIMESCCEEARKLFLKQGAILYPQLEDVLKTLSHSYSLFIVSNCQNGYIEAFLEYHKLGKYFTGIECSGNTSLVKGENIKIIIDKYKLQSSIYVGDAQTDCDAAKFANIPFVYASYGFGQVNSYEYIIEKVTDLLKLSID